MGGRGTGSYTAGAATVGFGGGGGEGGRDLNVAGWTPDAGHKSVSMANTVEGIKGRIQNLNHEQLAIVGKDGYVLAAVDGDEHSVGLTPNSFKYVKGNDIYHNHPNGGALSTTDVISAGTAEAGSVTAFSKLQKQTYTLKAGAKADGKGLAKAMQKDENKIVNAWQKKLDSMVGKKYASEESYKKQANKHYDNILGDWMKTNAGKYGYTYTVTK